MMTANLHCDKRPNFAVRVDWRRRIGGNPVGSADYFTVDIGNAEGQVTLFISPEQLESLATKLAQAGQDRAVVLAEERGEPAVVDIGGEG